VCQPGQLMRDVSLGFGQLDRHAGLVFRLADTQ
jgi:hypothetical protein